ncbi:MAG: hypothetical protein H7Y01_14890 [Ferruginibacter sp.]|nr:hypothetical protein [Chitinophagaceae bacterium]
MTPFEVFKSFYSEEQAGTFLKLFNDNGIDCKLEKTKQVVDKLFIGDGADTEFHLKLKSEDFKKANQLINDQVLQHISELDTDYYLFSFSDVELLEIINKPDEWNNQDVIISGKILETRGLQVPAEEINRIQSERIKELSRPEKPGASKLITGYVLAVFFCLLGLFYALLHLNAKKTLPDGIKVPVYDDSTKIHFRLMILISVVMCVLLVIGQIKNNWV